MKLTQFVLAITCWLLCIASSSEAKQWRGLVPLHSSRADVERLLGRPNISGRFTSTYQLESEAVSFIYSAGGPCGVDATNRWRVPQNTIVDISVAPKKEVRFSVLNLDQKAFKETDDPMVEGLFYYTNEEEGIRYSIQRTPKVPEGILMNVDYWPTTKDFYLRCNAQHRVSKISNYAPLEDYGDIAFKDEKPRLDNFASQLQHDPELVGYIVVYARRSGHARVAQRRANRAKKYIVNVRGIESVRILTIVGGRRETLTTELYLLRRDLPAPTANPSQERSESRTIRTGQSKKTTFHTYGMPRN
jgi:hypothetical protein